MTLSPAHDKNSEDVDHPEHLIEDDHGKGAHVEADSENESVKSITAEEILLMYESG